VSGTDPAASHCERPIVDAVDPQLLETLDAAHYVYERIYRPNFMQRYLLCWKTVNPPFRLTQQPKSANRAFAHPGRHISALYLLDQVTDVPVWAGTMVVMSSMIVDAVAAVVVRMLMDRF
jgi:hypothetical protein